MIEIQNNIGIYRVQTSAAEKGVRQTAIPENKERNQDKLEIRADYREIAEQEFARRMSGRVADSVRRSASDERLEDLERRVREGTYRIDVAALAGKIMLDGGEHADE